MTTTNMCSNFGGLWDSPPNGNDFFCSNLRNRTVNTEPCSAELSFSGDLKHFSRI